MGLGFPPSPRVTAHYGSKFFEGGAKLFQEEVMRTGAAVVLLGVVLIGCVSARATMLVPTAGLTPVAPDQVEIFLSEGDVREGCRRIALITTAGSATGTSTAATYQAARTRAGKIGANAILVEEISEPSTARQVVGALLPISADRKGEMIAFRCEGGQ